MSSRSRCSRNELKVWLRFLVVDQPVFRELNHYALLQITPLSLGVLVAVLVRIDRGYNHSTIVLPALNSISKSDLLSIGIFHSSAPSRRERLLRDRIGGQRRRRLCLDWLPEALAVLGCI